MAKPATGTMVGTSNRTHELEAEVSLLRSELDEIKRDAVEYVHDGLEFNWTEAVIAIRHWREELVRIAAQRDRAWRILMRIEDALGTLDEMGLAFILADSHGVDDAVEWNDVSQSTDAET